MSQLLDDRKMSDDIKFLRNKIESITVSMMDMKINDENQANNAQSRTNNLALQNEAANLVDKSVYNDFKNHVMRELESSSAKLQESKKVIEDIINVLSSKIGEKDLKFLEGK